MSTTSSTAVNSFLSVADLDPLGVAEVLALAGALKVGRALGVGELPLAGRAVALIFQKPSLRTRVSFEVGIARLGATPVVLVGDEVGLGSREVPRDVAHTLERYVDAIVARVFDHSLLEDLAAATDIPIINALSDAEHPCEALADVMALSEHLGDLRGRQLVYLGDGNNVAASLLLAGASIGLHVRIISPTGYEPDARIVDRARAIASGTGARIELGNDAAAGVVGADAVYTDVWASMGQEEQAERRRDIFRPFAVTSELLRAVPDALVMHCLPAHRGDEIASEVLDGPKSIVFDQAEDRLWVQMALMIRLLRPDLA
ncbi:MAG: ornithine carbamoyltransferase [Chloroflexi bacterium]|nr:ornithine carbamoyltransferase [Chloroflexota bacterium]